jgi:hypothetical protein
MQLVILSSTEITWVFTNMIVPKARKVKGPNENVVQRPELARPATYQNCMMICPSHASSELQRDDDDDRPAARSTRPRSKDL